MKTHTTSGIQVTEFDPDDTLDLELEAPALDALADRWEALADTFEDGTACETCRFCKRTWNVRRVRRERECAAASPLDCPALNPVPVYLKRQAS
jgi:hypothetical protein